ncbi:hypothetical protein KO528_17950 [Saccharophagus degradans]|uniref:hypothetical protein n=1 Tax=Saccharophagus degradans TaxID=86304 RepID=UPI001C08DB6F|nr:hypothetical protein [Saccharophagus degradans]MBU2987253.1 hypothetical protein [Saccharophagus degradans]
MLLAMLHIFGALALSVALCGIYAFINSGGQNYLIAKKQSFDISMKLGVPESDLDRVEYSSAIAKILFEKYNSDKFVNRLSDLFGLLSHFIWVVGLLCTLGIIGGAVCFTAQSGLESAPYAWLAALFSLAMMVFRVVYGFIVKVLIGRFPGEARLGRAIISEINRSSSVQE